MKDCIFCKIYETNQDIIYEDEYFFAQFDKFPVNPGHAEVIPKRHITSLLDSTNQEMINLKSSISKVENVIENANFNKIYEKFIEENLNPQSVKFCRKMLNHIGINKIPEGYNIGINEGRAAGRTIDHLHIHIIPRFWGDVEDPIGGVRYVIQGMGNYKKL